MKSILMGLVMAAIPHSASEPAKGAGLADYTCWALMTEPRENQGSAEIFYLGYALGRSGRELANEDAYRQVIATVLERCGKEPDLKVLDAFADAIGG